MNNKILFPCYQQFFDRSIIAFRAACEGPVAEDDENTPSLDGYLPVLQGRKLYLSGWVTNHPRFETTIVGTSMLIHVTHDARWARTLSRWYRLETPRRIDTSQVSPEVGLASYCPIIGLDGIGVPLRVARIVTAQRPDELARLALANGFDESATILTHIGKSWPPQT